MRSRYILIILLFLAGLRAAAQPPETIYEGTVIATGFRQSIPLTSDGPFNLEFTFNFFGIDYTQFYVSANGLVMFTNPDGLYNTETTIPSAATPNNYIAAFWDNLSIIDGGNVMYKTIGLAPSRKCVIQYKKMGFDPVPTAFGTFSVILYETSNIIQMQYRLIVDPYSPNSHGASATIGLEDATGTAGVTYAYHNSNAVTTEDAISFTPSGGTYTIDSNAAYDGIFLTTNITLPDPGIVTLKTPALDATIGTSQTFEWAAAPNVTSYNLVIDTLSSLSTASYYDAGLNLSYDIAGLKLDKTYYWAVFSYNTTALTWCEIRRFNTTSSPPLVPVPQTVWAEQGQDKTINLNYTGGDASPKTAKITSLPGQGQLYQYSSGSRGSQITAVPATITDASMNVIYAATGSKGNGVGNFNFKINDAGGDSPEGTVTVNVSPAGVPNVLYVAKDANVELQFDVPMEDPAGKQGQFTITKDGNPATINSASLKEGDPYTIILTLDTLLTGGETVLVSYTQGDVKGASGGFLFSFTSEPAALTAQTISFPQSLDKKYNESPFAITATASSGLGLTYNSGNTSVATFSGSTLTFLTTGTSVITLRQLGNATYAPTRYDKTLNVSKGDQTIAFSVLPGKTYGDADFTLNATSSSGLGVSYSSSNPAVATVAGNLVHIVGAGNTVITASQPGNSLWNPAPDVQQTLTVNKANQTITFTALPGKTYGDADFALNATSSSGLGVSYSSSNPAVATVAGNLVHITGAGSSVITASQAGNSNYNPAPDVQRTLTVSKAALTFTAQNKSKEYLAPIPALTYTISGFVNGETQAVIDAMPAIQTTAIISSPVGTYPVTLSGGSDNNYNFSFVPGTLTVTKITQSITFTSLPEKLLVTETFNLEASSTSGLNVQFESLDNSVATISGNVMTGVSKGSVQVRAYNIGDQNYLAGEAFATIEVESTHKDIMYLFTPNEDGFNDYWELPQLSDWGKCEVKVYNRWGKEVFADMNYNNLWDGTSDGNPLPEGAYYFIIKTENAGSFKGTVNIVR